MREITPQYLRECFEYFPSNGDLFWAALSAALPLIRAEIAEQVTRDVAELPDRSSPDDWPEAMLVTADELQALIAGEDQ